MSTIQEVRVAEKRVQDALEALKQVDPNDCELLSRQLQDATDEYAKAVRELN